MNPRGRSRRIGPLQFQATVGDITEQATEAVVNAANNHLWMGSGVAGAIKRVGGAEIETEAMKLGPIEPGQAVTTSAGRLKSRYCIHAAAMGQYLTTSPGLITRATRSALSEAARLDLDSVAFPALGTGVGGFPVETCAHLMVAAALDHGRSNPKPGTVVFVLRDEMAADEFAQAIEAAEPA
jgi:O-acetyl-ADP-ribose deacetylase (regulator of RNase III)